MTLAAGQNNDRNVRGKEWRRPELRKLPIDATSAVSPGKAVTGNADVMGGPKNSDAGSQFS
jgi:hypothetical protein